MSTINNIQTSGFYYDVQMSNPLLTATLHTNTYIPGIKSGEDPYDVLRGKKFPWSLWKPIESGEEDVDNGKVYCLEPITHNSSLAYNDNPSACYRKKPLITSILSEDFQVEIGNSWGDNGGTTQIESAFNQMKSMAPYNQETGAAIERLGGAVMETLGRKDGKGAINWVGEKMQLLGKSLKSSSDTLNDALIQQGTRFSYYGGTNTTFGNLSMRFTLFADWIWDDKAKDYVFKTVHDQLREIYPYTVGKYHPVNLDGIQNEDKEFYQKNKEMVDTTEKALQTFFGWQQPPAGFKSDIRSLDTCQQGTLRLVLGGYYTAENLIINGMNINFSKTMTKVPPYSKSYNYSKEKGKYLDVPEFIKYSNGDTEVIYYEEGEHGKYELGNTQEGGLTPLYADVSISLRPASSYSDQSIIHFSSNGGMGRIGSEIAELRNQSLQKVKDKKKVDEEKIKKRDEPIKHPWVDEELRKINEQNKKEAEEKFKVDEDVPIIDTTLEEEFTPELMINNLKNNNWNLFS